jgi:hypothetical protein
MFWYETVVIVALPDRILQIEGVIRPAILALTHF